MVSAFEAGIKPVWAACSGLPDAARVAPAADVTPSLTNVRRSSSEL